MHVKAKVALVIALLLALIACGCATLAPGADPIVVNTERVLRAADGIYAEAMAYYFKPGVAPTLPKDVVTVFEKVRTGFDAPYKDVQSALGIYKTARDAIARAKLREAELALAAQLNPVLLLYPSTAKPVEVK